VGAVSEKARRRKFFSVEFAQLPLTGEAALRYLTALFIYIRTNFSQKLVAEDLSPQECERAGAGPRGR
jgi:hypothetical protein